MLKLRTLEQSTKKSIQAASRDGQKHASRAKYAAQTTRILAREMVRIRKQRARLATSKAQLESVRMQVQEAFAVRRIEGSIRASTGVMRDVNALIRLPQLSETMRALSQELVKAGVIEEMVGDMMPDDGMLEGENEEAEAEVDEVLGEVLRGRLGRVEDGGRAEQSAAVAAAREDATQELDEEGAELTLEQMRGRLEALKS